MACPTVNHGAIAVASILRQRRQRRHAVIVGSEELEALEPAPFAGSRPTKVDAVSIVREIALRAGDIDAGFHGGCFTEAAAHRSI